MFIGLSYVDTSISTVETTDQIAKWFWRAFLNLHGEALYPFPGDGEDVAVAKQSQRDHWPQQDHAAI